MNHPVRMAALSLDLRKRIVAAFDRGGRKQKEVAELFSVSAGTVSKLLRQRRETGDLAPLYSNCKGKPKILAADEQRLRELIASKPDMTLTELRDGAGLSCTIQAVHYALGRMGLTFKKRLSGQAGRTARTSPPPGKNGKGGSPGSIPPGSSSSTNRARRPT